MSRALLLLLLLSACAGDSAPGGRGVDGGGAPVVRILLETASARRGATLTSPGGYRIEELTSGNVVERGPRLEREVGLRGASLDRSLRIRSDGAPLSVDGDPYPGDLLLVPAPSGVALVNETDLELYLPGVVSGELGAGYPTAALRAQAVAARTYALERVRRDPSAPWHLHDSTVSQRYLGLSAGRPGPETDAAKQTRGLVLLWAGRLFPAYYHSTCGGNTAAARDVLDGADLPPLVGTPCGFCGESPKSGWTARFPLADVTSALGLPAPPTAVAITGRSPDGRARALRFEGPGPVLRSAVEVRSRLGTNRLFSTHFTSFRIQADILIIEGSGYGHGAGMCQYGAIGMARAGASAGDILAQYYPAATLSRLY